MTHTDDESEEERGGRQKWVLEFEPTEGTVLELVTPGAKAIVRDDFTATAFARLGGGGEDEDDEADDDDDLREDESGDEYGDFDDGEEEEDFLDEAGDGFSPPPVTGAEAVRLAEEKKYWDIPTARDFVASLPPRVAAREMHRILPIIVRSWQAREAASFVWEMASHDVATFAALLDARGDAGVERSEPFRSIFGTDSEEKLSQAISFVGTTAGLASSELGRALRSCAEAWNAAVDGGIVGAIAARLTERLGPPKAAELLKSVVDGGSDEGPDDCDADTAAFFRRATRDWAQDKRTKLAGIIQFRWGWSPAAVSGITAVLESGEEGAGERAHEPKRPQEPPIEEDPSAPKRRCKQGSKPVPMKVDPKPKQPTAAEAAKQPKPTPTAGATGQKKKTAAAKKGKAKGGSAPKPSRPAPPPPQQQPSSKPHDGGEGDGDDEMEFFSMDELSDLFRSMGGPGVFQGSGRGRGNRGGHNRGRK